jgi:DNA-binding GntR family transcriptional regulator
LHKRNRLSEPAPQAQPGPPLEPGPLVRKVLGHTTMASAAAEELRRRILDGTYAAGLPLRQDALAEEFGISRIPIREALLQLEAEGLVRILPHRGAIVSELSTKEVEEVFELRALLEPRLLKQSAPRLTESDFAALRATLSEFEQALRMGPVGRWGELNTAFHVRLYGRAERPRTLSLVSTLLRESDRHTRLQLSYTDGRERAEQEHAELLNLCEARRFREASALLRAHIDNVGRTLMAFLAERRSA